MQRNVDEIPRQYKQAENNNFPEVPLKGGKSNNGLRTGSRFPPGLFTILAATPLPTPSVPAITSARLRNARKYSNADPFSPPRERRRKQANQFLVRRVTSAHSSSSNGRGRGKIRETEMHEKIFESFREKKLKKKKFVRIEKYDTLSKDEQEQKIIPRGYHDFPRCDHLCLSKKNIILEKNIADNEYPKNVTRKPIKGATSNQLFGSFPYRAGALLPPPFFFFFYLQFFNHENRNSPIAHVKIYSTRQRETLIPLAILLHVTRDAS